MKEITDPNILSQLNQPVSDPNVLAQLNAPQQPELTNDELLAQSGQSAYDQMSGLDKFGVGLAKGGIKTYYGLKDLFTDLSQEEKDELTRLEGTTGGFATAGELVTDLATLALPGAGAVKGAQALAKGGKLAKTLAKVVPFATDVAASSGLEALKAKEGEGVEAAIEGGTGAVIGGALAKSLGKLLKGANIIPEARQIIDKGGFVTPGRATDSGAVQALENFSGYTPFLAKSVAKSRKKADESWSEVILNEVAPIGTKITEKGQKGITQIKNAYDDAYNNAWKGADNVSNEGRVNFVNAASEAAERLGADDVGVMKKVMTDFKKLTENPSSKKIKELDNLIRKQKNRAGKSPDKHELMETLQAMRDAMRDGIPNDTIQKLKEVDGQYGKYLVARKAASKGAEAEGVFTPKQLLQSARTVGGESRTAMGKAPLQELATGGVKLAEKDMNTAFLDPVRRFSKFAPTLIPGMETMAQSLIGQTRGQKSLAFLADELRKRGVSGATIGGAYQGD